MLAVRAHELSSAVVLAGVLEAPEVFTVGDCWLAVLDGPGERKEGRKGTHGQKADLSEPVRDQSRREMRACVGDSRCCFTGRFDLFLLLLLLLVVVVTEGI